MSNQQRDAPVFTYAQFNVSALLHLAERLRNKPCAWDPLQRPKSGSLNWAIFLRFDDDVEWVFRSSRTSYAFNEETSGHLLAS